MKHIDLITWFAVISATALLAPAPSAAQTSEEKANTWTCFDAGGVVMPIEDRDGHAITDAQWMCHVDSGPLAGGMATGTGVWEWDGNHGREVTFSIVVRKHGAVAVLRGSEGKMTMTMSDGKPIGLAGNGRYDYVLATGPWAPLAGKTETWTNSYTSKTDFLVNSMLQ
jgi:hypothetical protein